MRMKKIFYKGALALMSLILLGSCSDEKKQADNPREIAGLTESDCDIEKELRQFSFDMLGVLSENADGEKADRFIYSPLSMNMLLSAMALGATESTLTELLTVSGLDGYTAAEIGAHCRLLADEMPGLDNTANMALSSNLWAVKDFVIKPGFSDDYKTYFNATPTTADLTGQSGADAVNQWIREATKGKIKGDFKPSPDMRMAMASAMYFKGRWRVPFDKKQTYDGDFHQADGTVKKVRMMKGKIHVDASGNDYCSALMIPFGNKSFWLTLLMADKGHTTAEIIDGLRNGLWDELSWNYTDNHEFIIHMPKFELATVDNRFDRALQEAGMKSIAAPSLGNITDEKDIICNIAHGATVAVDEAGAELTGVTYEAMAESNLGSKPQMSEIKIDRPFVFVLSERSSGCIISLGYINNFK